MKKERIIKLEVSHPLRRDHLAAVRAGVTAQEGIAQEGIAQEGIAQEGIAQEGIAIAQEGIAQEGISVTVRGGR